MTIQIFWIFLKLGCTSFGGPVAHLGYFRNLFVNKKGWFSEQEYAHLLSVCQTLPGPASSQVGFAIGLLKGGYLGATAAFLGFTLPSIVLLIAFAGSLSVLNNELGQAGLQGLAILALVVVLQAVIGMGKQILSSRLSWVFALFMFVFVLSTSALYWQIVGIMLCALCSGAVTSISINKQSSEKIETPKALFSDTSFVSVGMVSALISAFLFCALFVLLPLWGEHVYPQAASFYQSGSMVFGGGHVVLPFLEQTTVANDLLTQEQFLAGYGATQAVPGPMFSFASYLGYLIELNQQISATELTSNWRLIAGAVLATVFLFLPGFLLVATFLPISQQLLKYQKARDAFAGANAAVVGLLAATLYDPIFSHAIQTHIDLIVAAIGFVALARFNSPILVVVLLCVVLRAGALISGV